MKNINIYLIVFLSFLSFSCTDDDKLALDVEEIETGAFLRTINLESGGIDFLNLDTAEFSVIVEVDDAENGELVESIDLFVALDDRTPDDGGSDVSEVLVKTIPASSFTIGEDGLPRVKVSATAQEALSALGLSNSNLSPGDVFRFRLAAN